MKRLPPAKRNQLIGVIIATFGLICLVYFVLIGPQKEKNANLGVTIREENLRLDSYRSLISKLGATTNALAGLNDQLIQAEGDVASGDLYAWTVDTIRRYKAGYKVEIPTIGQPGSQSPCELIGNFPYNQIRFSLSGAAYYHDLGKFVADFENTFPHCRVVNLSAAPAGNGPGGSDRQKLNFTMDIVALVKPNN
jgi:hypothetical protein